MNDWRKVFKACETATDEEPQVFVIFLRYSLCQGHLWISFRYFVILLCDMLWALEYMKKHLIEDPVILRASSFRIPTVHWGY